MDTPSISLEQKRALLALVWSLIPDLKAVVAGGFAADWTRAQDIDVWMLGDPLLENAGTVFKRYDVKFESEVTVNTQYERADVHATARLVTPLLPIHIIGTEATTVGALLETFDISTHRWALTRKGMTVEGKDATTPYEPGRVLLNTRPMSTEYRRLKLEGRYDIEIAPLAVKAA